MKTSVDQNAFKNTLIDYTNPTYQQQSVGSLAGAQSMRYLGVELHIISLIYMSLVVFSVYGLN